MNFSRLSSSQLSEHLAELVPADRRIALALRRAILKIAPHAREAVKFHCLCYFHADAAFGAIGGNICMIEVGPGGVALSFIHGANLPDPHRLLQGNGKAKRRVRVERLSVVQDNRILNLIRSASTQMEPDVKTPAPRLPRHAT